MFHATVLTREESVYGLGFLFEVEFANDDRSTLHQYLRSGRFRVDDGVSKMISTVVEDVRFQCPNDDVLYRSVGDHVRQFNVVEAGSMVPIGTTLDLSRVDPPPPPPPPTPEQLHAQAVAGAVAQGTSLASQINVLQKAGADIDLAELSVLKRRLDIMLDLLVRQALAVTQVVEEP
jgi:hypothetical protein